MTSSGASSPLTSDLDENKPLWKYVTKLGKSGGGGGNYHFKCNYCFKDFKGSYTRVRSHLLKISGQGI